MPINFNLAPEDEDGYIGRATGTRREPPAVCRSCGGDVEETPRFGNEATCDECARKGKNYDGPDDGDAWSGGFAENH